MLEKIGYYIESQYKHHRPHHININSLLHSKLIKPYIESYLFDKLRKRIAYAYQYSPFYKRLYAQSSIDISHIKTIKDIQQLPFTTSRDILTPDDFFCVPKKDLIKSFQSSGTTGKPKITYYTKADLDDQIIRNRIGFQNLYGITSTDSARIYYGPEYAVFYCAYNALEQIGASISYSEKRKPVHDEYQCLTDGKVTTIIGDPSHFFSLSSELSESFDLSSLSVKSVILGSEPLPEFSRKKYESLWDTDIYSAYGLNEVGVSIGGECKEKQGIHVTETDFFVEIIDPQTEDVLDDGEKGEIVFTTLNRMGMPLIRYKTNDIGYIIPGDCPCGLPFKRIIIESRKDDMFLIGYGENVYPANLDQQLLSIPSIVNYQLVIERENEKDFLTVIIESDNLEEREMITEMVHKRLLEIGQIRRGIQDSKLVEIKEIIVKRTNSIQKTNLKQRKVVDKRNMYINQ